MCLSKAWYGLKIFLVTFETRKNILVKAMSHCAPDHVPIVVEHEC